MVVITSESNEMEFPHDTSADDYGASKQRVLLNVQDSGGDSTNYDVDDGVNINILGGDDEYANDHILETQSENNALANE